MGADLVGRTTEEAQGGKAVGVDPSLITACECCYFGVEVDSANLQ